MADIFVILRKCHSRCVRSSVEDTGIGISSLLLGDIAFGVQCFELGMDPFITTLLLSRRIIQ